MKKSYSEMKELKTAAEACSRGEKKGLTKVGGEVN
jgi:hypothetical protein